MTPGRRRRRASIASGVARSCRAKRSSSPAIRRSIPNRSRRGCAPGSRRSSTSPVGGAGRRQTRRPNARVPGRPGVSTIRCSAGRTRRSAPKRAACTSARAGAAARAARAVGRPPSSSSNRRFPARWQRDERSLFDGVDTIIAGLAQFAGARAAEGARPTGSRRSRRPCRPRRSGSTPKATTRPCTPLLAGLRAVRVAARSAAQHADRRGGAVRDRLPPAPEGARVPAGDPARQRRARRSAGRRRRGRARTAGAGRRSSSPITAPPTWPSSR